MSDTDKKAFLAARKDEALKGTGSWFNAGVKAAEDWSALIHRDLQATQVNEQMLAVLKKAYSVIGYPADDFSDLMRKTINAAEAARGQS